MKPDNIINNRKVYVECLRIIAAFLVIVNHTNVSLYLQLSPSPTWFITLAYTFICVIAVPIFLMITGSLLLDKQDTKKSYIKRIGRIIGVIVLSSFIYYIYFNRDNLAAINIIDFLKYIFSSHITNAFWYLYMYLGILLLMPLLQKMAKAFSKQEMKLLLIITLVFLGTIPIINNFTQVVPSNLMLDVLFSPCIGLVFLGYYITKYWKITKKNFIGAIIVFIAFIVLQVLFTWLLYDYDATAFRYFCGRFYLTTTITSASVFVILKYLFENKRLPNTLSKITCYFGSLTFGIYLLSDLIIDITRPLYNELASVMHIILALIIWEVIIFVIGAIITALLKLFPFLKKWI